MNKGEPHSPQEPLTAIEEALILIGGSLLSGEGVLQLRASFLKDPKARKGAPEALRQAVQWQTVTEVGRVLLWNLTSPQAQVPLRTEGGAGALELELGSIPMFVFEETGGFWRMMNLILRAKRKESISVVNLLVSLRDQPLIGWANRVDLPRNCPDHEERYRDTNLEW